MTDPGRVPLREPHAPNQQGPKDPCCNRSLCILDARQSEETEDLLHRWPSYENQMARPIQPVLYMQTATISLACPAPSRDGVCSTPGVAEIFARSVFATFRVTVEVPSSRYVFQLVATYVVRFGLLILAVFFLSSSDIFPSFFVRGFDAL